MALKTPASNHTAFVPISEAYYYSDGVVMRGLSQEELFKRSYVDPQVRPVISIGQIVLVAMNAMVETDDHFRGYDRHRYPPSQLVLMLRIMMACETLERAMSSLTDFHAMGLPISIGLHSDGIEAQLKVSCDEAFGGDNAAVIEDIYLNTLFGGLSYFLGRRFPATAVTTRNRGHVLGARHWSISAPIHVGDQAALHFPTSLLRET